MRRPDLPEVPGVLGADEVAASAAYLVRAQQADGAIPWFTGGHIDPWDHVECAMALSAAGEYVQARRAYEWLARTQRADGSWPMKTRGAVVEAPDGEANHAGYPAVGVWHHLLVTGDAEFAARMWPTVRRGIGYVLSLQTVRGEVAWVRGADGTAADEALLTACSSLHQALRCGIALGEAVGDPQPDWELAADRLGHLVYAHEDVFADRSRYSMDWYYPVLGGAVRDRTAHERLDARWDDFVVPGLGARCVSDQPWVTGAETCELALALHTVGRADEARELLAAMQHLRDPDGSYWTGWQFGERVRWPVERSTWTAAAVILTADALSGATGGSGIFAAPVPLPATATPVDAEACGCARTPARRLP
ncbi:MAG: prenyltransferase [Streptosporangiales bacterium]|nr:prenyltransferase [Streptosporangiales bacterium]